MSPNRIATARVGRFFAFAILAAIGSAAAETAPGTPAAPPKTEEAAEPLQVKGFRSAQWGMNANEVKAAIKKDFNIALEKVRREENPSERTTVFSIDVPELIEGAGKAHISYILGYKSKSLIQVNITWGTPVDKEAKIGQVVAAANQLRALFISSGYQPDTITSNVPSSDGTIVVFQGQDAEKHTTLLRLANGAIQGPVKNGKREPPIPTIALQLSYIMDARSPDIFRLKKGQF